MLISEVWAWLVLSCRSRFRKSELAVPGRELGAGRELGGVGVVVHAEAAVPDLVQGSRLRGAPGHHPAQVQKAQKQMRSTTIP